MATIKLKRGSGVPSGLAAGEPAMDTATGRVYISKDGSSVVEVGSSSLDSTVSNDLTVGNNANITNNLSVGVDLTVGDDITVGDNLSVGGNVVATGSVTGSNLNVSNWNIAYNSRPTDLSFNTSNGVLSLESGSSTYETTDLDGRYLQAAGGFFVPVFSDESGNTASIGSQYGTYKKIFIGPASTDFVMKWFMISVSGVNTSGLVSTDKLVIDLTSVLQITAPVSAQNILVTEHAGYIHSLDRGSLLAGFPENNNQNNSKIVLRITERDSQDFIRINDITSGSNNNNIVLSGWFL